MTVSTRTAIVCAALQLCAMSGMSHAYTVNIDSKVSGCAQCNGPENTPPGTSITPYSPVQLTLGAGTYTFTNGASSGYYSAWNFQGYPNSGNWAWNFVVADAATNKVVLDDYVSGVMPTQAAMADKTGTTTYNYHTLLPGTSTAGFVDTLTLTHTTTLNFMANDYGLYDNGGGVALNIAAVPEPEIYAMMMAGLGLLGFIARHRKFC